MKKHFSYLALVFILLTVMVFGACAKPAPVPSPPPTPTPAPTPEPTPTPAPEPEPTPPPMPKEVELKYDDGSGRDFLSSGTGYGYLIDFLPLATPFTVKKVKICGALYGEGWEGKSFTVAIWDKDYQLIHLETRPVTEFVVEAPTWVEVEMPEIEVTDKFYVHVFTDTCRLEGIHIGADDSVVNEHSDMTVKVDETFKILAQWPYWADLWFGDKSKVNWMIRVVGTAMLPAD